MPEYLNDFIKRHALPNSYLSMAEQTFSGLLNKIVTLHKSSKGKTLFIGLNGCQGSGKTTLTDYLVCQLINQFNISSISCSLDDFYLGKNERNALAQSVHPLLKTRGVPGTHNTHLLELTMSNFSHKKTGWRLSKFDKSTDNPFDKTQWTKITHPIDVVFFEGWCWATPAQEKHQLVKPLNPLEANDDKQGIWRGYVNEQITNHYQKLYQKMDLTVMLKAPSFSCVYQWRLEQENKLRAKRLTQAIPLIPSHNGLMNENELAIFILHFQRLTQHSLSRLPNIVDFVFELDKSRHFIINKFSR